MKGRGDSNLSGDIALVPGATDSIFFPGTAGFFAEVIAISCSASLMKSRSPSCSDSNIASGRAGRFEGLLSVLRMAAGMFPCGLGGGLIITTPLVALARRPRLRRLQRKRRPIASSRVTGGCSCLRGSYRVCAVIGLPALAPMPPAPLGLLIPGGACRIRFVRLRNGLRGHSLRSGGEVTTASGVRLLCIRRKITPPA